MPKERSISVGYASAVVRPHDHRKGYVVERVWVDPEHRGKGDARRLMEEIDRKFARHDLWLRPRPFGEMAADIEGLRKFYESLGFSTVDDKDNMLRPGSRPNYARAREKTAELAEDGEHKLQGHIDFQGLQIAVENRKGSVRSGKKPDGGTWRTVMKAPYGYIEAPAKGKDGESIDVYVGPKRDADTAFVVHQHKPDGTGHDEDKVILGVEDESAARKLYLQHYDDPKFLGPMDAVPMERLKKMVEEHRKLTKIAFDEEDADKVLRAAKPRKLRISEDGYMSEMNPRSKTSPVVKSFLQKHVQVPGTAAGQQAFGMLVDDASFDPVDVRAGGRGTHGYIQTPKRGDSVDALRRLQREAAKSRYSDPADVGSLRAVATTEFTPPQRKMLNALAEGHELNELHYGNHGQTPARFVDGLEHAHPGVLLREHNAVATLPESMSPIRKAMAGMRSLESPMFEPYGVRLGNSGRLSRHAIKRISEDITRGGPQRAFDSMHDFVQRMHAAQAAKGITLKIAGVSSPGATVKFKMPGVSVPSLKIKSGVPTISAPSVKSPPGTPQL